MIDTGLPLAEQLKLAQNAFTILGSDVEMQRALAEYGYDAARLAEGRALLEQLVALQDNQKVEYNQQYESTRQLTRLRTQADKTFEHLVKTARVAFADNQELQGQLGITGERKNALSALGEWLEQAGGFYRRALASPTTLAALATLKVDRSELETGLAQCQAVQEASARQNQEKAEAVGSTRRRDEALAALQKWLGALAAMSRIALADNPDKLKALGLKG